MAPRWLEEDMEEDVSSVPVVKGELELAARLLLRTRNSATIVHFEDEKLPPLGQNATEVDSLIDSDDSEPISRISWLAPQELEQIRLGAKRKCIELQKDSNQYQDCNICLAHRKITLMLKSDLKSIVKLTPTTPDEDLSQWCSFDDGRRGLERFVSLAYSALRNSDIYQTRMSVLQEQCNQRERGMFSQERIAHAARRASRRARSFARFFGEADANEAKRIVQSSHECHAPHAIGNKRHHLSSSCSAENNRSAEKCSPSVQKRSKLFHCDDLRKCQEDGIETLLP